MKTPLHAKLEAVEDPTGSEALYYEEHAIRFYATRVFVLKQDGLLAVQEHEDGLNVDFVVFRFAFGSDSGGPALYERLFAGEGPSGDLRELRHTFWGMENDNPGYIFYAPGALIADAFDRLTEWFDCE